MNDVKLVKIDNKGLHLLYNNQVTVILAKSQIADVKIITDKAIYHANKIDDNKYMVMLIEDNSR